MGRMESSPTALLAPGLLDGVVVATAGGARAVADACASLGAATPSLDADLLDEPAVTAAAQTLGRADVLVCDAAAPFVAAGGGLPALRAALDGTWNAVRAVVNAALRPAGGGKVVLLFGAPVPSARPVGLLRVAPLPVGRVARRLPDRDPAGDATAEDEVALLAVDLASRAGDYFSGCAFRLGSVGG